MDLFSHRRSTQYFILCVAFVSHICGETTCPSSVKVEKGTNSSITCNTDEINPDFYWYKGEAKQKDLIGKLEKGISTVSEQYVGAYAIDLSASLGIRNAGRSHQSLYTLVTFNTNGTSEEDEVILKITKDATKCPENVTIEKCTASIITCTTDESTSALYWYKSSVEEENLIGKVENGYISISQQYSDKFDIGQSGSLQILNAVLSHESLYILLTFDSDGIQDEDKVVLNITRDATKCPENVIMQKCTDSIITCTTDECTAALYWYKSTVEEKNLIGKVENGYFSISQKYSDKYDIDQSGSLQILNAGLSHESLYILLTFDSDGIQEEDKVILNFTKPCNLPKPTESPGDSKSKSDVTPPISVAILVTVIVLAVALIGLLFIGCCFLVKKNPSYSTDTMQSTNSLSLQPMNQRHPPYIFVNNLYLQPRIPNNFCEASAVELS